MNDQAKIESLTREVETLKQQFQDHQHFGISDHRVNLYDLLGTIKTITIATDLTNTLNATPTRLLEQIFIDTTTATKKLYVYDMVGKVWRSVTIA